MSTMDERRWRRHMTEEAAAIAAQQVTAGGRHSPVGVPLAYGDTELAGLVRARVAQVRRECADLLEDLIGAYESRAAREIPIEELQALVARMLASAEEAP